MGEIRKRAKQCWWAQYQTQAYPDGLIIGAGEQLGAVSWELDELDPAQVTTAVSHFLIGF